MPIVKIADYVGFYRHLAVSSDIHALSGRGGDDKAGTEFANARILAELAPGADDILLDIGCGDGSLLGTADGRVGRRIGVVPNVEEQRKLQLAMTGITFLVGKAQALTVESESVTRIVCNGVLLLLEREELVMSALKEIGRVARPKARIWLGEIPSADELAEFGKYRGSSVAGYLWHDFRQRGPRGLLSSSKAVVTALGEGRTLVLCSARIFFAEPEKFIAMAERCGLRLLRYFKYERLDRSGKIVESPFRYNYIFAK